MPANGAFGGSRLRERQANDRTSNGSRSTSKQGRVSWLGSCLPRSSDAGLSWRGREGQGGGFGLGGEGRGELDSLSFPPAARARALPEDSTEEMELTWMLTRSSLRILHSWVWLLLSYA